MIDWTVQKLKEADSWGNHKWSMKKPSTPGVRKAAFACEDASPAARTAQVKTSRMRYSSGADVRGVRCPEFSCVKPGT